jgi:CTP synthase
MRFIFVTGAVVSGLGKGVTSSSLGALLRARGLRVTAIKIDPYLNVNAGNMSPFEHGEVYVLDDGGEVDLDLGSYERFLGDVHLTGDHNLTTGKLYTHVIQRERRGDYLGKTVQVIPHLTDAIQDWILRVSKLPVTTATTTATTTTTAPIPLDVCLVEVGGTVGDAEQLVYLEALRQLKGRVGVDNVCHVHVSLVPTVGEHKTKPTQRGVRELLSYGLVPDLLVCRTMDKPLSVATINKIAASSGMTPESVISVCDTRNIYAVPIVLAESKADTIILQRLKFTGMMQPDLERWSSLATHISPPDDAVHHHSSTVVIGIVGKYTMLKDAYLSLSHALKHASHHLSKSVGLRWIEADDVEKDAAQALKGIHGLLVPGGFGNRGVEGMIAAVKYARLNQLPFFGICLGLQIACIEWARNILNLANANSTEFDPKTQFAIIHTPATTTTKASDTATDTATVATVATTSGGMDVEVGKMCLGSRLTVVVDEKSLASQVYGGKKSPVERHRHRYQLNLKEFESELTKSGFVVSGRDKLDGSAHIIELPTKIHPFFFAVQYHPEFLSRPFVPSPPFVSFINAAHTHKLVTSK